MKRENKILYRLLCVLFFLLLNIQCWSQVIPNGSSMDSLVITTPTNTYIYEGKYGIHYYKPVTYNSFTSPILFYVHGIGGNGTSSADLQAIADRQNALIVAPTMHNGQFGWAYVTEFTFNKYTGCYSVFWYTQVFKSIYRHVLARESRSSIDSYLTGFSAGGQFVTRYMLIRQFSPDSIPIKMAVSVNPSNYTLMTDTFNNTPMYWTTYRCGLGATQTFNWGGDCDEQGAVPAKDFICNEHVKQYYNENYGVLCGSADTQTFTSFCPGQGADDRWGRYKAFWAFSKTNAITRGTTLKWVCDSVVGVGHDQPNMYNTKRNVTDTFTIAERLLFKTPFHIVQQFNPKCLGIVGINEQPIKSNEISVYPNPNNGSFVLKIENEIKNGELLIINAVGQEVYRQKIIQGANNINDLGFAKGLYNYVLFQDKQKIKAGKIILE